MPTKTDSTSTPAINSASSTARWMDFTVFSMLTTTPLRNPSLGLVPTPTIFNCPLVSTSPMITPIFVVPISNPTIGFAMGTPSIIVIFFVAHPQQIDHDYDLLRCFDFEVQEGVTSIGPPFRAPSIATPEAIDSCAQRT